MTILNLLLFLSHLVSEATANFISSYPECAKLSFDDNNNLDLQNTLYSCANNLPGSLDPPSYYPMIYNTSIYFPTNISTRLVVNNLISVDDINAQVSMDVYLRLM